ncbi:hypothetical protein B0H67DRAFT_571937 [Lasiosphaeris hirsuta]|uniref:YCII-related domain-containing protein n=1 Tax=Lasiosphaeris hirsuta TaxID=260670 RepID=A0AA40B1K6_9PEZI|nr:hypothetical protein B0H67DRAFT_571937 [Lasiosphaeris hirsuta]
MILSPATGIHVAILPSANICSASGVALVQTNGRVLIGSLSAAACRCLPVTSTPGHNLLIPSVRGTKVYPNHTTPNKDIKPVFVQQNFILSIPSATIEYQRFHHTKSKTIHPQLTPKTNKMPKFALFVRATPTAESDTLPANLSAELEEMGAFNTTMADAGVLLVADGFLPSSRGARVHFSSTPNTEPTVARGPFDVASLVSGYWIIKVADLDEAVAWAKKVPFRTDDAVVEVRRVASAEDFGELMTEEVRKVEEGLRARIGGE